MWAYTGRVCYLLLNANERVKTRTRSGSIFVVEGVLFVSNTISFTWKTTTFKTFDRDNLFPEKVSERPSLCVFRIVVYFVFYFTQKGYTWVCATISNFDLTSKNLLIIFCFVLFISVFPHKLIRNTKCHLLFSSFHQWQTISFPSSTLKCGSFIYWTNLLYGF